jgi:hypothetical protein
VVAVGSRLVRLVRVARVVPGLVAGATCLALASACKPDLDQTISLVTDPSVLAIQSDPAEAAPTTSVKYRALYVDRSGTIPNGGLRWDFCEARKPLADLGPVNAKCEQTAGDWFVSLGDGEQVAGTIPPDACKLFGPDVPPPVPGQPQGRPVDPDTTGGYYDPIRILAPSSPTPITIDETRLSCGAGVIPAEVGVEYQHRYHANTNPVVAWLAVAGARAPLVASDQGTNPVPAGAHVTLELAWASCPTTDACGDGVCGPDETSTTCEADCTIAGGCSGAERFVVFDLNVQAIVVDRESMAVAWYTTGGSFDADRTGRDATDLATTSDNGWTAPTVAGNVHLWVVLRDDRGGVGWAEYVFDVR